MPIIADMLTESQLIFYCYTQQYYIIAYNNISSFSTNIEKDRITNKFLVTLNQCFELLLLLNESQFIIYCYTQQYYMITFKFGYIYFQYMCGCMFISFHHQVFYCQKLPEAYGMAQLSLGTVAFYKNPSSLFVTISYFKSEDKILVKSE